MFLDKALVNNLMLSLPILQVEWYVNKTILKL